MGVDADNAPLRDPWVIAAFEGWGDAADASVDAIDHILKIWDGNLLAELDPDEFYDFQFNRPLLDRGFDENLDIFTDPSTAERMIWGTTSVYAVRLPSARHDLLIVRGIEPNMRWRRFCTELLDIASAAGAEHLIILGSLLADTPHSLPVPISGESVGISLPMGTEDSDYGGPVGIGTVLKLMARDRGLATASLWAGIPHYVGDPPCPKATLALLSCLEDITGLTIDPADPIEMSAAWQYGAEGLVSYDLDLAEYVRELESEREQIDLPEATGDAIAREFERYLRRRKDQ